MSPPHVIKVPLPRPLIGLMGLSPVTLGIVALVDHSPSRPHVAWAALAMALLWGLVVLWGSQRAIVLDDQQLTTRGIRRRRIPRAEVVAVEVASDGLGQHPVVVLASGQRTALNLVATRAETQQLLDSIRHWAGVPQHPAQPAPTGGTQEATWREPAASALKVSVGVCLAILAVVPVSLLWHRVPWWGWLAALGLATLVARPLLALRGSQVRLYGDELVIHGRREVRIRAVDVVRVVTVSEQNRRHSMLQLRGRAPLRLPTGDRLDERSAGTQRWAQAHGSGVGSPTPFQQPRSWRGLLHTFLVMACAMGSLAAATPRPASVLAGAVFPFLMALWTFFQPTTVVRDWSDRG